MVLLKCNDKQIVTSEQDIYIFILRKVYFEFYCNETQINCFLAHEMKIKFINSLEMFDIY